MRPAPWSSIRFINLKRLSNLFSAFNKALTARGAAAILSARLAVDRTEMENVADARPSLGRPDLQTVSLGLVSIVVVDSSYIFYG
jgi:hypothetical protein